MSENDHSIMPCQAFSRQANGLLERLCGDTCPYVCPQTWLNETRTNIGLSPTMGFLNENDSMADLQVWDNCGLVCLLLWAF